MLFSLAHRQYPPERKAKKKKRVIEKHKKRYGSAREDEPDSDHQHRKKERGEKIKEKFALAGAAQSKNKAHNQQATNRSDAGIRDRILAQEQHPTDEQQRADNGDGKNKSSYQKESQWCEFSLFHKKTSAYFTDLSGKAYAEIFVL